jgi:hypothetical protein
MDILVFHIDMGTSEDGGAYREMRSFLGPQKGYSQGKRPRKNTVIHLICSCTVGAVFPQVRCPNWRLEEVAEKMHMKLRRRDGLPFEIYISMNMSFSHILFLIIFGISLHLSSRSAKAL